MHASRHRLPRRLPLLVVAHHHTQQWTIPSSAGAADLPRLRPTPPSANISPAAYTDEPGKGPGKSFSSEYSQGRVGGRRGRSRSAFRRAHRARASQARLRACFVSRVRARIGTAARKPSTTAPWQRRRVDAMGIPQDEGLRPYFQAKIEELEHLVRDKAQNLRRLEAQRNEINSKGTIRKVQCGIDGAEGAETWRRSQPRAPQTVQARVLNLCRHKSMDLRRT